VLWMLLATVGVVLLIGCAHIATPMMARAAALGRVRGESGASRTKRARGSSTSTAPTPRHSRRWSPASLCLRPSGNDSCYGFGSSAA